MKNAHLLYLIILSLICILSNAQRDVNLELKQKRANLVKKHLKRLKKLDGGIKLVGGKDETEGNVEIFHNNQWGAVCDDEWDEAEADVVCRQLGYEAGIARATQNSFFGPARRKYWMDNLYCDGSENDLINCRFDGWGYSDCDSSEAAGVICRKYEQENSLLLINEEQQREEADKLATTPVKLLNFDSDVKIRLRNGRTSDEGRVEILMNKDTNEWEPMCGDGWSLLEANVICKTLNLGYASDAMQTNYFGGNLTKNSYAGVKCIGNEAHFSQCKYDAQQTGKCIGEDVAAVSCTQFLADLIIDHIELQRTAHLEDRQMFFLQCAMEENCLATSAYTIQKENPAWHLEPRRLLKFTAKIFNAGTADFRPAIPKHLWEWHMCHMHYHSMEVFATFDIYDKNGLKVAEGHKASFCLEDNQCMPGVKPKFACANYGDQGISVNCSDIYKFTVDCQWVDISDLEPGIYTFKVAVNPEFKVPEMSFENNAAICQFYYTETYGTVTNCTVQRPHNAIQFNHNYNNNNNDNNN